MLLALVCFSTIQAQPRGKALYNLMSSTQLVTMQGSGSVRWMPNEASYYALEAGDGKTETKQWYKTNPVTKQKTLLFDEATRTALLAQYNQAKHKTEQNLPFDQFTFVQKGASIFFKDRDKAKFLFTLADKKLRELKAPDVVQQPNTDGLMRNMPGSQLWNGEYSPDYNSFAYVVDYDLYVADTRTGRVKRITTDGNESNRFNGRPNWVYPEEFGQVTAYWWSPDSKKLAYYQSDESAVHKYPIAHDEKPVAVLELESYPKAGEANPTVNLFIADVATNRKTQVRTNSTADNYMVRPTWLLDSSALTFQRVNRQQNVVELLAANPASGIVRPILIEKEDQFVNLQDDYYLLKDQKNFLWSSERSGYRQLYLCNLSNASVKALTEGTNPVANIVRVDEQNGWIYYNVNENLGMESHLYRVKMDGTGAQKLTSTEGMHGINMDATGQFYVDSYSNFSTAQTTNMYQSDGKLLYNMVSSNTSKVDDLKLEKPELIIFKAADGVTDLAGVLYKPAGYDPSQKYPLIVSVYGGPHSKAIRNSYGMSNGLQALAQLGYLVWQADNRGLTGRGKAFETATYRKLGQVDLADHTAGVKQLCGRSYVDCTRVGVFGHSYGGYMTAISLLKEPDVFQVGVAGAPVTDWRNYDTIYTERYMNTPQVNAEGYDAGSAMKFAKNLKGKLLLVHGTIDNNVHTGNTMQLIDALVKEGKDFDMMMYPKNRHGIGGAAGADYARRRLAHFEKYLKPQPVGGN